ncbi:hypothetical protein SDC9_54144 [bioreactor metagenome]|uniref:Acyl-CoA dehydrogenase C-terminal domain-containing protein n=1 Tax=bioreactor metagenome TaxID=1076179 RepID=A0A644WV89_9ZZZZ
MWTCSRGSQGIFDEPLYRYPTLAYQAQVHAACNLGLARAALDLTAEMSGGAKLMPGSRCLAERGYFRKGLAEGEAGLRAARARRLSVRIATPWTGIVAELWLGRIHIVNPWR